MKIRPIGNRLVLKVDEKNEEEVSGIIVINKKDVKKIYGEIIAISDELSDKDKFNIGDKVVYDDTKGLVIDSEDSKLVLIDRESVLGIVEE